MLKRPLFWALAAVVLAGVILVAFRNPLVSAVPLPAHIRNAPHRVVQAYEYAYHNAEELAKYPCFCGCGAMGHTSNLSCYIQNIAADGTVTWDNHALGCGICVDIALDVMRLKGEGQASPDVRRYIDGRYGSFGPGTNTPFPLS